MSESVGVTALLSVQTQTGIKKWVVWGTGGGCWRIWRSDAAAEQASREMIKGVEFKGNEPESAPKLNIIVPWLLIVLLCTAGAPPSLKLCLKGPLICKKVSLPIFFERCLQPVNEFTRNEKTGFPFRKVSSLKDTFRKRRRKFLKSALCDVTKGAYISPMLPDTAPSPPLQSFCLPLIPSMQKVQHCSVSAGNSSCFYLNLTNETRWSGRLSKPGASASQALTYGEREARRHSSQRRFFCLKSGDKYDKKDRPFVIKWKQP